MAVIVTAHGYSGASKAEPQGGRPRRRAGDVEGRAHQGHVYDGASGNGLPDAVIVAMQVGKAGALEETKRPEGST